MIQIDHQYYIMIDTTDMLSPTSSLPSSSSSSSSSFIWPSQTTCESSPPTFTPHLNFFQPPKGFRSAAQPNPRPSMLTPPNELGHMQCFPIHLPTLRSRVFPLRRNEVVPTQPKRDCRLSQRMECCHLQRPKTARSAKDGISAIHHGTATKTLHRNIVHGLRPDRKARSYGR